MLKSVIFKNIEPYYDITKNRKRYLNCVFRSSRDVRKKKMLGNIKLSHITAHTAVGEGLFGLTMFHETFCNAFLGKRKLFDPHGDGIYLSIFEFSVTLPNKYHKLQSSEQVKPCHY